VSAWNVFVYMSAVAGGWLVVSFTAAVTWVLLKAAARTGKK